MRLDKIQIIFGIITPTIMLLLAIYFSLITINTSKYEIGQCYLVDNISYKLIKLKEFGGIFHTRNGIEYYILFKDIKQQDRADCFEEQSDGSNRY